MLAAHPMIVLDKEAVARACAVLHIHVQVVAVLAVLPTVALGKAVEVKGNEVLLTLVLVVAVLAAQPMIVQVVDLLCR